ncbi:MAG: helix-turn-helix transcriptional regulator [Candidatus Gastranaerophilales bacterium]
MDIKQLLGLKIKELRVKNNLKQFELAEIVGIAVKHQSCIETGKNFPSADLIEKYAKAFNIEATDLFSIKTNKTRTILINEIEKIIKNANDNEIQLIHKILKSIFSL